uniref:procollagen-proline 4-dioxygenase n=1 Tax=Zeugodacus cucurbitae TaxID=28588 RepID=A0A0A1WCZ3_ZEUCU
MQLFFLSTCMLFLLSGAAFAQKMEFFSSVHQMSKLVQFEGVLLKHMQRYVESNEHKLDFLKARLAELESDRYDALQEGLDYFDSPVNKYLLTKRLTLDWERVENIMQHDSGKKALNRIEHHFTTQPYPESSELEGAIAGFLRIQDIYRLKSADMAQGILEGVKYDVVIDARLCLDIAKYAKEQNQMRLAHAWALEALERFHKAEESTSQLNIDSEKVVEAEILELLAKAKTHLGDFKGANQTYADLVALRPDVENYTRSYLEFQSENSDGEYATVDLTDEHEPLPADLLKTDEFARYKHTCNGLITQTPSEERALRCGYLTETHPFLLIAPIKTEELNHDPLLVVYYDVVSDAEIEEMKSLSNDQIVRATVMGRNESIVSPARTSQFAFLPKTSHKLLQTIDVRAGYMSDLNMTFAEDHQFQNYGIGGHYGQHYDSFDLKATRPIHKIEMGNRIATLLFYLTDVEQGGGTAFPFLKRLLMPKKGAAAFWYNLHADGERDFRTLHGGCPIIVGSKWVLNRWIREFVQSDRRPCELWRDSQDIKCF